MKLAILADIHSNLAALETVVDDVRRHRPDAVVVAGDVVNRGPDPAPCVDLLEDLATREGWRLVRGNHEDFVVSEGRPRPERSPWLDQVYQHTTWTARKLRHRLAALADWPDQEEIQAPDGGRVRIVHASMRNNRTGLYDKMTDEELRGLIAPPAPVLCVGHTHRAFVRRVDGCLVVNAGAVGLPFDRDPRASYAMLAWSPAGWQADIVRVEYDRRRTERAFEESGYAAEGGPMVRLVADELRYARPNLMRWHLDYEEAVAQGLLTVEESVDHLLTARRQTGSAPMPC